MAERHPGVFGSVRVRERPRCGDHGTLASPAIASGADVKVVQLLLGHQPPTLPLDLYGHLFPDRLDELADRFDDAACAPDVPAEPTVDDEEDDQ